jgi:hypothetical protein
MRALLAFGASASCLHLYVTGENVVRGHSGTLAQTPGLSSGTTSGEPAVLRNVVETVRSRSPLALPPPSMPRRRVRTGAELPAGHRCVRWRRGAPLARSRHERRLGARDVHRLRPYRDRTPPASGVIPEHWPSRGPLPSGRRRAAVLSLSLRDRGLVPWNAGPVITECPKSVAARWAFLGASRAVRGRGGRAGRSPCARSSRAPPARPRPPRRGGPQPRALRRDRRALRLE